MDKAGIQLPLALNILDIKKGWLKRNSLFKYCVYKAINPKLSLSQEDKEPYLVHFVEQFPFRDYVTNEFDPEINAYFNRFAGTKEMQYLLRYDKPCFIEPRYGWIISEGNIAFRRSLPYGIEHQWPLPHYIYYKRKKKVYFEEALPLFYNWYNYWHFYNDIIGSLMVLDKIDFDKKIPIIIPQKALSVSYVKDFFETDYSKKWNWYPVDNMAYVYLEKAYVVKSFANVKQQFLFAADIFKTPNRGAGTRRIFLNRAVGRGRNILNIDEVLPLIRDYGYEIMDTDGMTIYQQKELFESASQILGIHGAGMTNIFFRYPENCTVLEIFPKNKYPIHYYWLSREFEFQYDCISGEDNEKGSFVLSPQKLKNFLEKHDGK